MIPTTPRLKKKKKDQINERSIVPRLNGIILMSKKNVNYF